MARPVWTNAAGDFSWATAGNWSTGSVPVNGDDVWFDGLLSNAPVTGGLAQSAVALSSLNTKRSYSGMIGSEGSLLQISATAVFHRGGVLHYHSAAAETTRMVVDTDSRQWHYLDGRIKYLNALKGRLRLRGGINSSGTNQVLSVAYRDNPTGDVLIELLTAVTANPAFRFVVQTGGRIVGPCAATPTDLIMSSGVNDYGVNGYGRYDDVYISGGVLNWISPQIGDVDVWALGGRVDMSKRRDTIGITPGDVSLLALWPNGKVDLPDDVIPTTLIDLRHEQEVC